MAIKAHIAQQCRKGHGIRYNRPTHYAATCRSKEGIHHTLMRLHKHYRQREKQKAAGAVNGHDIKGLVAGKSSYLVQDTQHSEESGKQGVQRKKLRRYKPFAEYVVQ